MVLLNANNQIMEKQVIKNYSHTICTVCNKNINPKEADDTKPKNFCGFCVKKQPVNHFYTTAMVYGIQQPKQVQNKLANSVMFKLKPIEPKKLNELVWTDTQKVEIPEGYTEVTVTHLRNTISANSHNIEYIFDLPPILYDYIHGYEFQNKPVKQLNGRWLVRTINVQEFNDVCKIFNFKVILESKTITSPAMVPGKNFPYQYAKYTSSTCKYCNHIQKLPADYKSGYNCDECGSLDEWKHNFDYSSEATINLHRMTLDSNRWYSFEFATIMITKINGQFVYEFIIPEEFFNLLEGLPIEYYVVNKQYHIVIQNNDDLLNKFLRTLHWKLVFPEDVEQPQISTQPLIAESTLYPLLSDDGITFYGTFGFNKYYQIWYIPGNGIIELLVNYEMKQLLSKFHTFKYIKTGNDMYLCSFNKVSLASIGYTLNNMFIVSEEYPVKQTLNIPMTNVILEPGPLNNGDYVGSWFDADLPQTQPFMNRIVRYSNGDVAKPTWRIWIVNPVLPKIKDLMFKIGESMNPKKRTYFTPSSKNFTTSKDWNTNDTIVEITFTNEFPIQQIFDALGINPVIKHHE